MLYDLLFTIYYLLFTIYYNYNYIFKFIRDRAFNYKEDMVVNITI